MTAATVAAPNARRRGRLRLRFISIVMLIILGGVAVASSLITQGVIRNQERVLLQERTEEAASVLSGAFAGVEQSLSLLGTLAGTGKGGSSSFATAARSVIVPSSEGLMVTAQRGSGMVVTAAAGDAPVVGQAIPADQEPLARRALSTTGMVSGVLPNGSRSWLAFALGNAAGPGTVVWERVAFSAGASAAAPGGPWGNLNIALYLSGRPNPATLIVATTRKLPLAGGISYPFTVGADTWLLVASSPAPLVGGLAQDLPWIILIIGAVVAALVTTVVET